MAGNLPSGQPSRIAPAGEASAAPQRLTGGPIAGAVYAPGDDEVYFLTPAQLREAIKVADELDAAAKEFIEKTNNVTNDEASRASAESARKKHGAKLKAMVADGVDTKKRLTEVHFLTSGRPHIAFVTGAQKEKWRAFVPPDGTAPPSKRDQRTLDRKGEKGLEKRLRYREQRAERKLKLQEPARELARQKKEKADRSWLKLNEKGERELKRDPETIKKKLLQAEIALKAEWRTPAKQLIDWHPSAKSEGKFYDASAGAQILRYTAGASVGLVFDPMKRSFKAKADAKATFALAEAEATFYGYLPERDGWKLTARSTSQTVHLCSLRFAAAFKVQGFLGANAAISAQIGIEPDKKTGKFVPIGIERMGTDPKEDPSRDGGLLEASAFAGGQLSGTVGGALQWCSTVTGNEWQDLAKCEYTLAFAAGIGFEGAVRVLYQNGKFIVYAALKVVLATGGGGNISFSVDAKQVFLFIKFLYDELRRADFGFLEWIAKEAFEHWSSIVYYVFVGPAALTIQAISTQIIGSVRDAWREHTLREEAAKDLARRVSSDPSLLTYATPEVRGRLLYHLTDPALSFNENERAEALVKIFQTIQSRREWNKTLRSVVPAPGLWLGPKGFSNVPLDQEVFAMDRIGKMITYSIRQRYFAWITNLPDTETHLRENLSKPPEQVNRWKMVGV
jgi:hypothetical protein